MDNSFENEADIKELKHDKSFTAPANGETNEETRMPMKDTDITLSMAVLLLACLGLAALAHVIVS